MSTESTPEATAKATPKATPKAAPRAKATPKAASAAGSVDGSGSLANRLADPDVEQALLRLIDRLDKIEAMVDALGTLGQRMPVIAEALGSGAAWAYEEAKARGVQPIEAGQQVGELALAAAHPDMLHTLQRLVDKRATLAKVLDALDQVDDDDLAALTTALVDTRKEPTRMVGPLMALFKLGDPDIQRAIGFSLEFARRLGRILRDHDPS